MYKSIVIHEVLHALGFDHEQSRYDRDSFVNIYYNNIKANQKGNFQKNDLDEIDFHGTEYDYKSIMHYSRKSFTIDGKTTIEAKFDPLMQLGNDVLSPTDIVEINRLYQCDVKSGWGKWSTWSNCLRNWKDKCTKARVRICVSKNTKLCPGVNSYGTQSDVKTCPLHECVAAEKRVDGHWGNWSRYSQCSGVCDWGTQERHRTCNNPVPSDGGLPCAGKLSKQKRLCRRKR